MARSSAAASNIAKLPPEVQAAIASLPYQDQEVFSYIALHDNSSSSSSSWSALQAGSSSSSSKKKGRAKNSGADAAAPAPASKMSDHAPSFVCACFVCYMAYWSLYDASPNKVAMDDAFALNDSLSLAAAEASSSSSSSTTSSSGQRRSSSSSSSPWGKRRGERGKAKKKCSNRVSSPGSVDVGHQYQHPSPPTPPPLSEYQHHRFDDQEERKRGAGKKAKDDNVPSKPRSKQVAPFDFKEEEEEEARRAPSPEPESAMLEILEDPATKPQSLGSRVSEAVCFVCEKLLGMWYPRLRRRNSAENR